MKSEKQQLLLGHNNICIVITIYITIDINAVLCTNQESAIIVHYDYEMFFFFRVGSLRTVSVRKRRHLLIRWEFVLLFVQNWVDGKELSRYFQRQFNSTKLWITSDTNQIKESALHRGITNRLPSLICIFYSFTDTLRDTKEKLPGWWEWNLKRERN